MPHPANPVRGDLITLEPLFVERDTSIPLFSSWGRRGIIDFEVGRFSKDQTALVVEDLSATNGNGVRIILDDGRMGWVNVNFVRRA